MLFTAMTQRSEEISTREPDVQPITKTSQSIPPRLVLYTITLPFPVYGPRSPWPA